MANAALMIYRRLGRKAAQSSLIKKLLARRSLCLTLGPYFSKKMITRMLNSKRAGCNLENTVAKLEAASWMPCKCSHLSVTFCQADDGKKNHYRGKVDKCRDLGRFLKRAQPPSETQQFSPPLVFFSSCHTVVLMALGLC